jgi:cell division protein FtsZ
MGTAVASGSNRAIDAANRAINSPLLEDNCIQGAQGILINITGSSTLSLHEVHEASSVIQQAAHENANIIFGAVMDDAMKESVKITVIAAGFREIAVRKSPSRPSYLPKTWRAGREQSDATEEPQQQPLIQQPNIVQHANVAQQRFTVPQPVAPQPPPAPVVQAPPVAQPPPVVHQPNIVQQVARNVSEAIHDIPDDLDVPTFLRHRTQKA